MVAWTLCWFILMGLLVCLFRFVLNIITTSYYIAKGVSGMKAAMALENESGSSTDIPQ